MLILGQDKELIIDAQVADVVAQGCDQKPENCDLASSTTASTTPYKPATVQLPCL